ncbi:viroplasmin family protein [Salicibibacter cibarius]|uniref:Ribonuclease H n=1 Tax=Salicibibacter cibarius TaxID=2743000 RepID=A0A7T6Z225_9BACI|nr:ribonuclease H family protein [Salicibibacter cibarius]QQK75535.1 viroplasmin family protein [Salicibibacter cibarius]
MAKKKYYVVWKGRNPGIYQSWPECQEQVSGYKGARFKSFSSKEEAERAYHSGTKTPSEHSKKQETYIKESISVDVGTRGNPGPVEYRGVYTKDGSILFERKPFSKGTNNMGEFLAIVHALDWQAKQEMERPIYSDSQTAITWVENKKAKPTLPRDKTTKEIWDAIDWAEKWLQTHKISVPIKKWDTQAWGEIKADYERK